MSIRRPADAPRGPGRSSFAEGHLGLYALVVLACAVVVIAGLRAAQALLVPFVISLLLAIISFPSVGFLRRHRVPTVLAVLAVVLVVMGVLAGFGAMVGGSITEFTEAVPRYRLRLQQLLVDFNLWMQRFGVEVPETTMRDMLRPGAVMDLIGNALVGLAAALSNTVLVLLTMVFMLMEGMGLPSKLRAALGATEADVGRFGRISTEIQRYLVIKTIVSLATGLLIGLWVGVLGVDFALLWGLVAFLLNYVPNLGSIIAAVPAVLLALVQYGVGHALLVLMGFVAVNMLLGNLLEPVLMGRRLGLSTLVVFLSLVFWGWVWGPVGMLLSVPLTMIAKIFLENTRDLAWLAVMLDSPQAISRRLTDGDTRPAG